MGRGPGAAPARSFPLSVAEGRPGMGTAPRCACPRWRRHVPPAQACPQALQRVPHAHTPGAGGQCGHGSPGIQPGPGSPSDPQWPQRSPVLCPTASVTMCAVTPPCGLCPSQPFRVPGIQNPGIFTRWSPPAPAHSNSDVWAGPSFSYIILHVRFSAYSFQVPVVAWQVFPRTVVMAENRLLPEVFLEAASTFLYFPTQ